ncbi:hypothetical protein [Ferrovibrio sp.]|uniref:hypothetical protein n=1 Tax=Ferrovibrio sp. TaxID=1917215 RepID=UPI003518E3B2
MELPLDPTVPLAGIALILLLVWLTGGRHRAAIAAPAEAAALLALPETGFAAAEIAVSRDGSTALARDAAGHIAVVFGSGARLAARRLPRGEVVQVAVDRDADQADGTTTATATLCIRSTAFTHRDFVLRLDAAAAADWQRHLQAQPA